MGPRTYTYTLALLVLLGLGTVRGQEYQKTLKVMAWNILHGGNDIENGPQQVIAIIKELDPDILLMVETYGSGKLIAETLGYHFHLIAPEGTPLDDKTINLSIYSKFPFGERIDTGFDFYLGGREVLVEGKKIRVFANWFHYLPWENAPEQTGKSVEELLDWEKKGKRTEMIQKVLPHLEKYASQADTVPMILAGDMNTPSHLDWGEATKSRHNGLVVPWYATRVLEDLGFADSYREVHPNPNWHPGITWDAKDAVDSNRIDYVFYNGDLRPIASESYMAFLGEPITLSDKKIPYPSDHGIVLTTFVLGE
ncbi:MAG: endonuclease/exonuclease/phosphatase family protein [Bacteroidota bacterium]